MFFVFVGIFVENYFSYFVRGYLVEEVWDFVVVGGAASEGREMFLLNLRYLRVMTRYF